MSERKKDAAGSAGAAKKGSSKAAKPRASRAPLSRIKAKPPSPALEELLDLLPQLDEEGLGFLLEQAHIHRYNMEVERLNEESEALAAKGGPAPAKSSLMRLERSADGSTYHVVFEDKWKMFSAEEIAALVRITRSGEEGGEIARRVYAWLDRERRDALDDLGIGKPPSTVLAELVRLLLASFPGHRPA
ncbi:MAG TPA: hypothetical protein VMV90_07070 [Rectinemataceae bacterium]|nr:hypothetical protein [Rectinemataceae bacterium]